MTRPNPPGLCAVAPSSFPEPRSLGQGGREEEAVLRLRVGGSNWNPELLVSIRASSGSESGVRLRCRPCRPPHPSHHFLLRGLRRWAASGDGGDGNAGPEFLVGGLPKVRAPVFSATSSCFSAAEGQITAEPFRRVAPSNSGRGRLTVRGLSSRSAPPRDCSNVLLCLTRRVDKDRSGIISDSELQQALSNGKSGASLPTSLARGQLLSSFLPALRTSAVPVWSRRQRVGRLLNNNFYSKYTRC